MVENPTITTPRDAIPDWAQPKTADEQQAVSGQDRKITDRQRSFLLDLIAKKDVAPGPKQELIIKCLRISEDPEEFGMSASKASELIDWYLKQRDKPGTTINGNATTQLNADRLAVGVPAGRYAVENDLGELRFYTVWVSRDKKRLNVYVAHGPDESDLKYQKTVMSVLNKIKRAGIRECAIRYGMEIGHCSNCGRRLTNRISRVLGIGPVCGGRMFGDDFKTDVKKARAELKRLGLNPDEEWSD